MPLNSTVRGIKLLRLISVVLLLTVSISSHGEIVKIANTCETSLCFHWWPKLPPIAGWHHDKEQSFNYSINAQAPDGFTFTNAETVIYAKAIYKPREPNLKTIQDLIERDIKDFTTQDPSMLINALPEIKTKDNTSLKSYGFIPKQKGNWEQVTYGEEGEFYLIFTISSRSKEGYENSINDYKKYINEYSISP